jgi:hypothetical protein
MAERMWRNRLRWRVRGAWQWPAFAIGLAVDALLLTALPIAGDAAPGPFAALLLAGVLQLAVVAAGARLGGRALRRLRPGLPKVVADDRAAAGLLVALSATFLAFGLVHRSAVSAAEDAFAAQATAARAFVLVHAPAQFRANFDRMDTVKQATDQYRTCVPGPDHRRAYCVYVYTDEQPARVVVDAQRIPNASLFGPDSLGRRAR